MLIDQNDTLKTLRQIVVGLTADGALQDDLTQEALIHLWLREQQCPGQTQSWYFQSCRFHLRTHLCQGRSIDSIKHRTQRCVSVETVGQSDGPSPDLQRAESPRASVSAREIFGLLSERLRPAELAVLRFLAGGHSVRDIARKLKVSHQAVSKHRQAIAALAVQLGILPMPKRTKAGKR